MESFLNYAQDHLARGRSIIPLYPRLKTPFSELLPIGAHGRATWKPYSLTATTMEEATRWSRACRDRANIGQVMGKVSNVFGIDVDFRHGGEATWRELSGGGDIFTETTLTDDGFHLIFNYPGYKFKFKEKLPGIDLRSDNSYLVAPPSIHPSGKAYRLQRRGVILDAPDFLVEQMVPDGRTEVGDSIFTPLGGNEGERAGALSGWSVGWGADQGFVDARVVQALRVFKTCEAQRSRYPSLSEFDFGVMVKLFNRDYDFETIYAAFHVAAYRTHYRKRLQERSPQAAVDYLQRMWARVIEQPSFVRDKTEVSLHADQLREQVESRVWKGIGGKSDKALIMAHIEICVLANRKNEEGDYLWDASVRDLAEKAQIGIKTVCKANQRLIKAGWLILPSKLRSSKVESFSYRFGEAWTQGNTPTPPLTTSTCVPSCPTPACPRPDTYGVFENRAGLGKSCEATWWALIDGYRTKPDLEKKTGAHPKTIERHIKKMSEVGMVSIGEDRLDPDVDFDFKQLGELWKTIEISRRRAEKHDFQRQIYAIGMNQREQPKNEQSANDSHEP